MTAVRVFIARLRGMFQGSTHDAQLSEEVANHLELLLREYAARGLPPEEAHRAARREFGGVAQMAERYRDQRSWPFIESIVQDIRFALRLFSKDWRLVSNAVI